MTAKAHSARISGFTLLEILIAIFILAIVLSLIYGSFTGTLKIINEVESESTIYQMARVALERIREDLECSTLDTSEDINFLGENQELDGRHADALRFLSTKHLCLEAEDEEGKRYPGLTRIAFNVEENDDGDGFILYRFETPQSEVEDDPNETVGALVLCEDLYSVNFIYHDAKGDARDQWDSSDETSKGGLPAMVSIQLEFVNQLNPEEPLKFLTGVALPMAKGQSGEES